MKWFDRWFARKCEWAWNERRNNSECIPVPSGAITADNHGLRDGTNIYLKRVIGGFIVTFNSYDRKQDHSEQRTYIITDEQEFQSELVKCITMECLRR